MRERIGRPKELAELRRRIRMSLADRAVPPDVIGDFVLAVSEAVASVLASNDAAAGHQLDVRWTVRDDPRREVVADIRVLGETPSDLTGDDVRANVLRSTTDHVKVDELVGGSTVAIRRIFG